MNICIYASELAVITGHNKYQDVSEIILKLWQKNFPDDYNEISNKYYSEEEKQEAEFNLKMQKERDFFKQEQLKRRLEYQAKLKELGIVLPKVAFANTTPNFVVDITKLPIKILYDYGFIPITKTDEQVAADALLNLNKQTSNPISAGHLH